MKVVIGSGAAGLLSVIIANGLGKTCALVEQHAMGGDCLNVGCVPSKVITTLLYTLLVQCKREHKQTRKKKHAHIIPHAQQRTPGCLIFFLAVALTSEHVPQFRPVPEFHNQQGMAIYFKYTIHEVTKRHKEPQKVWNKC